MNSQIFSKRVSCYGSSRVGYQAHKRLSFSNDHQQQLLYSNRNSSISLNRTQHTVHAADNADFTKFDVKEYFEASIIKVQHNEKNGQVLHLKIHDGAGSVLPVFIGEFEGSSIDKELNNKKSVRPLVYDLFRTTVEALQSKVTRVCIIALVKNTYHARIHFQMPNQSVEVGMDSRPSDALNLALRFSAPIYIKKEIANKMATHPTQKPKQESVVDTEALRQCREELLLHKDPTFELSLKQKLAVEDERYKEAGRLQKEIDAILQSDRELGLMVSLEAAIEDGRVEDACSYTEELKVLRTKIQQEQEAQH